jgi:hypothetical protein
MNSGMTAVAERGWLRTLLGQPALLGIWCIVASFGTYACMYGFRKPFTAGTYLEEPYGVGIKAWLVMAQVLGYTVSKFVGIRVIAAMPPSRRAATLLGLIGVAELALVLFAVVPRPYDVACLFVNGLPLGMVFGLVLGFLEGRRMTEAFVAGLCASFILADGVAKSVGASLLAAGVSEAWMPAAAGGLFLLPLVGFVAMLGMIPPPTAEDVQERSVREPMSREDRARWWRRHGWGLAMLSVAYLMVTVLRSLRADFAPELWTALGTTGQPGVFARSEIWVALGVFLVSGSLVVVRDNRRAFNLAVGFSLAGLGLVGLALVGLKAGVLPGFGFMVLLGVGLYLPYVMVHTTLFERLIALTRDKGNLGYLMYLADASGYLGYVAVMFGKSWFRPAGDFLTFFSGASGWLAGFAGAAFAVAWWRFSRVASEPSRGRG